MPKKITNLLAKFPELKPNTSLRLMPMKVFNWFCVVLIIILALAAGYFQSSWKMSEKNYAKLEDKYVRVRYMLGTETTQRLINESYNYIDAYGQNIDKNIND